MTTVQRMDLSAICMRYCKLHVDIVKDYHTLQLFAISVVVTDIMRLTSIFSRVPIHDR